MNPYLEMLQQGLITKEEYQQFTGEKLEIPEVPAAADPALEDPVAHAQKIKALGLEGGYRQPTEAELARAEAVKQRDYPGEGYRCPFKKVRVKTCPLGDVNVCAQNLKCEFASILLSRTNGNRRIGNMVIDPNEIVEELPEPETLMEQAATRTGNKNIQNQAMAILKMRRRK